MIFLLFFLLLAAPVWAEATVCVGEKTEQECWTKGEHTVTHTIPPGTRSMRFVDADGYQQMADCLATMEAAMRAMERYVDYGKWIYNEGSTSYERTIDSEHVLSSSSTTFSADDIKQQNAEEHKRQQVVKLWADAKRCWQQP